MSGMPSHDLSNWLSKADAAARLQISERTLDRRCDAGTGPERRNRPRVGLKPEPVFNPEDIERLAATPVHVLPPEFGRAPSVPAILDREYAIAVRPPDAFSLALERIAGAMEAKAAPQALYLTLPEARVYSGLSLALLRRVVREGKLPSIRDGSTKVRRADLDDFDSASPIRQPLAKSAKAG
ncbi:MAG: hypothetical protein ABI806_29455 [Candidatus Solibacter sp.]